MTHIHHLGARPMIDIACCVAMVIYDVISSSEELQGAHSKALRQNLCFYTTLSIYVHVCNLTHGLTWVCEGVTFPETE
jgi:hypothetical protein